MCLQIELSTELYEAKNLVFNLLNRILGNFNFKRIFPHCKIGHFSTLIFREKLSDLSEYFTTDVSLDTSLVKGYICVCKVSLQSFDITPPKSFLSIIIIIIIIIITLYPGLSLSF